MNYDKAASLTHEHRNRIRTTSGLETVPSLQKLYMSNNEIQGLSSLNLSRLTKLQTIQMEGNPVWSNPDYSYHLVSSLPSLVTLPPASTDSFQTAQAASGLSQAFSSNSNRRLTQDSPSPLSLVMIIIYTIATVLYIYTRYKTQFFNVNQCLLK